MRDRRQKRAASIRYEQHLKSQSIKEINLTILHQNIGKRSTDGGWSDSAGGGAMNPMAMGRAGLKSTRGGPPGARGGRGRGGGALGDLFSGGFMPNPGALRGASRGGRGGAR